MTAIFRTLDAAGNVLMDQDDLVFRFVGRSQIAGSTAGDPNLNGSTGSIVDSGFLSGEPFCRPIWIGTAGGSPSSADPPYPNISFTGSTLNYNSLWGDWLLIYGVA